MHRLIKRNTDGADSGRVFLQQVTQGHVHQPGRPLGGLRPGRLDSVSLMVQIIGCWGASPSLLALSFHRSWELKYSGTENLQSGHSLAS